MADSELEACSICYLDVPNPAAELVTLPCGHALHPDCIVKWIEISPNKDCPYCRTLLYYSDCQCVLPFNLLVAGADLSSPRLDLSGTCAACLDMPGRLRYCVFCCHVHPAYGDCFTPADDGMAMDYSLISIRDIIRHERGAVSMDVIERVRETFLAALRHLDPLDYHPFIVRAFDEVVMADFLLREIGCASLEVARRVTARMAGASDFRAPGWRQAVLGAFRQDMSSQIAQLIAQERGTLPSTEVNRVIARTNGAIAIRLIPFHAWKAFALRKMDEEMNENIRYIVSRRRVSQSIRSTYREYIGNFIQRMRGNLSTSVLDRVMATWIMAVRNGHSEPHRNWKHFVLQTFDREMARRKNKKDRAAERPEPICTLVSIEVPPGYFRAHAEIGTQSRSGTRRSTNVSSSTSSRGDPSGHMGGHQPHTPRQERVAGAIRSPDHPEIDDRTLVWRLIETIHQFQNDAADRELPENVDTATYPPAIPIDAAGHPDSNADADLPAVPPPTPVETLRPRQATPTTAISHLTISAPPPVLTAAALGEDTTALRSGLIVRFRAVLLSSPTALRYGPFSVLQH